MSRLEINGCPSWLRAALDAPAVETQFGRTTSGTWAITTTTAADTTVLSMHTATVAPRPGGDVTLYVVTGPPAAGKSTWVKQRAKPGDITIDFDDLAATLTPCVEPYVYPHHPLTVAKAVWRVAVDAALQFVHSVDVYIIHTRPPDRWMTRYARLDAKIVTIDPGRETVFARCRQLRPEQALQVAEDWYADQHYLPFC